MECFSTLSLSARVLNDDIYNKENSKCMQQHVSLRHTDETSQGTTMAHSVLLEQFIMQVIYANLILTR